jgi:hypothetical protein
VKRLFLSLILAGSFAVVPRALGQSQGRVDAAAENLQNKHLLPSLIEEAQGSPNAPATLGWLLIAASELSNRGSSGTPMSRQDIAAIVREILGEQPTGATPTPTPSGGLRDLSQYVHGALSDSIRSAAGMAAQRVQDYIAPKLTILDTRVGIAADSIGILNRHLFALEQNSASPGQGSLTPLRIVAGVAVVALSGLLFATAR